MNKSRKIYTYTLPIIIILNGYASGISGMSVGAIIMNLFNLYAMMFVIANRKKVDVFFVRTIGLLTVFFVLSCIGYLAYGIPNMSDIAVSLLKIFTWFIGVTFTSKFLFDFEIFKPYYRKFCIVCTGYLFLQMLTWNCAHIYLPNLFEFGPIKPLYETYSASSYINYLSSLGFGRFSSFFAEPAYYSLMMAIGLILTLFDEFDIKKITSRIKIEAAIIILGVWLSTSTAGILFVCFIVVVCFIKTNMQNKFLLAFASISVGFLLFVYLSNSPLTTFFFNKVSTMDTSGRVGGSYYELKNLSFSQTLFGVGCANQGVVTSNTYMNVFAGLIMEYGVLGIICFLYYIFKMYIRVNSTALHVLVIVYLAAMSQGGYLFNLYGILIFTIALHFTENHVGNNSGKYLCDKKE